MLQSLAILRRFSRNETFIFGGYFVCIVMYRCRLLMSQVLVVSKMTLTFWSLNGHTFELPPEKNERSKQERLYFEAVFVS